jgi:anti-sigma factor RsiW
MRCARVEPLIERFVDGDCDPAEKSGIEAHALTCARCTARIASARRLAAALGRAQVVRAPRGFNVRVMNEVYRQALAGHPVLEEARALQLKPMYRRLGISFMVTAFVLSASLLIPRAAYPTLIGARGVDAGVGGSAAVQSVLQGADRAVRGILGE